MHECQQTHLYLMIGLCFLPLTSDMSLFCKDAKISSLMTVKSAVFVVYFNSAVTYFLTEDRAACHLLSDDSAVLSTMPQS